MLARPYEPYLRKTFESLVLWTGGYLIIALILLRLGVFALMVGTFFYALLSWFPITADLSAFYSGTSLAVLGLQLAVLTAGLALCLRAREPDRRFGGDGSLRSSASAAAATEARTRRGE